MRYQICIHYYNGEKYCFEIKNYMTKLCTDISFTNYENPLYFFYGKNCNGRGVFCRKQNVLKIQLKKDLGRYCYMSVAFTSYVYMTQFLNRYCLISLPIPSY